MTIAAIQVSAIPASQAPAAPAAPSGIPRVVVPGADGATHVYSKADVAALRARAAELSHLIRNASDRRNEVRRSLNGATGADKAGLEARLGILDARIVRLEGEIDENSSRLASLDVARTEALTSGAANPDLLNRNADRGMAFGFVVLLPIVIAVSRNIWRRGSRPYVAAPSTDTTHRLERMEQAMEAIAIEIERVSEGQRFMTRLMSQDALGAGQAPMEPVVIPDRVAEQR